MVLELHVFGPAFGLPSFDAECLATIVYLRKCYAHYEGGDSTEPWRLVASSDLNVSPFRRLPAMRVRNGNEEDGDQDVWVAGFTNIVTYLRESSYGGALDIDAELDDLQQADNYALLLFIRSRGGPVLDLSLFVSSENYNSCTRPALGESLHWPESWTLPHRLRENARHRSEHLGLSALDVDSAREQQEKEESVGLAAHIPKSLRKSSHTVSGLLGKSAQQTKFRLEAVTEDFMEPLSEKLQGNGEDNNLLRGSLHSVDCLAIAYLTLMQQPVFPQAWLQKTLVTKYSLLGRWASKHAKEMFGPKVTAAAAMAGQRSGPNALPWTARPERTVSEASLAVMESLVSTIPGLRSGYDTVEVQQKNPGRKRSRTGQQLAYAAVRRRQIMFSQIVTSSLAATSMVAWLLHAGVLSLPQRNFTSGRRNFGEAGSLLGIL